MNSLSKIALFTLLSGAVFAAQPPTRMPAWRCTSSRRRAGAKHQRQRRHQSY